jgi:hypothetical protein
MGTEWTRLSETERGAFTVLMAFLNGRLASAETINWALQLGPGSPACRQSRRPQAGRAMANRLANDRRILGYAQSRSSRGHETV